MKEGIPHETAFELDDKPREECGLYGIYAPGRAVTELTRDGLLVLQHRGQEGAGICVSDGQSLTTLVDEGLVSDAFRNGRLQGLEGSIATGHVRYGTLALRGSGRPHEALQPMPGRSESGIEFAVSHNGHIDNFYELTTNGKIDSSSITDSKLIARLISYELNHGKPDLVSAIAATGEQLSGAYTLVIMSRDKLYGVRDPHGFRPLVLGELDEGGWVLASEKAALDMTGAELVREVEGGEIVEIDESGVHSHHPFNEAQPALCGFEFVYFSRPDAIMEGVNVAQARIRMGKELAKEHPATGSDLVIGTPDSGSIAALGFSRESGIQLGEGGLIKNRYIGRSFIESTQEDREKAVRMKFNANPEIIKGKSLVLVDDSIVRGTTTRIIVNMLRESGAREIHLRISSSPYRWPCFYGMDTGDRSKLIAARLEPSGIQQEVGADSLGFLSVPGLRKALGPIAGQRVCLACMTKEYPTDVDEERFRIEPLG